MIYVQAQRMALLPPIAKTVDCAGSKNAFPIALNIYELIQALTHSQIYTAFLSRFA
jgi:hypothetical protein